MTYKIDLHIHTKNSGDNYTEPEEAVLHAIESGLHGLAFTEHYFYEASEHAEALREKYGKSILIFRGVEYSSTEGHCLIFGVNTDVVLPRHAPVEEIMPVVAGLGGIIIPSHPFRGGNSIGKRVKSLSGLHAIEGYNGYSHYSQNLKAVNLANELSLSHTGGSDAHEPQEVGACFTEFADQVTYDNFLDLLRAGHYHGVDTRKVSKAWIF
jgi:predicted metal-dependent phosphoesterase TrpH